jgi:hypothetical protein
MRIAQGLAIPKYLLRISSVQVHQALGRKHGGKADQECDQANIYPGKACHATPTFIWLVGRFSANNGSDGGMSNIYANTRWQSDFWFPVVFAH